MFLTPHIFPIGLQFTQWCFLLNLAHLGLCLHNKIIFLKGNINVYKMLPEIYFFFQFGWPKIYWCYAMAHVIHIINRFPSITLNKKTPCEMLRNLPPMYFKFKIFICLCFATTLENDRIKLEPRFRKRYFFLAIKLESKVMCYLMINLEISPLA